MGTMAYHQGNISFTEIESNDWEQVRSNILLTVQLLESKPKNIRLLSDANKSEKGIENQLPAELVDACILAQKESLPVLTEDYLYLQVNEIETKKQAPEYFSSLILLQVLNERGEIGYEEYLNYFGYLSSYRFRFLPISPKDIEKAVFGDGLISVVNNRNIAKFNFPLTLSKEYGVAFSGVYKVIGFFVLRIIQDNTIPLETTELIFVELLESLPKEIDKGFFGKRLLKDCSEQMERQKSKFIDHLERQIYHSKIEGLIRITDIFDSKSKFLIN